MPKKSYILKDFSGGMNLFKHTSSLEDNESPLMINVRGDKKGKLRAGPQNNAYASSLVSNTYLSPAEGLHGTRFDYGIGQNADVIHADMTGATSYTAETAGISAATITITDNVGIIYGDGGANYQAHAIKLESGPNNFYPGRWYVVRMHITNIERTLTSGWPGHLEFHINDENPVGTGSAMLPAEYRWKNAISQNGIFMKVNPVGATPVGWCNTMITDGANNHIAYFMIKTPSSFTGGASITDKMWITGHINGTATGAAADTHIITNVAVARLPFDIDHNIDENYSDVRTLFHSDGGFITMFADDDIISDTIHKHNIRTYDNSDAPSNTTAGGHATTAGSAAHQSGQLVRISEGNYYNVQNSESKILGYVVNELSERLGGYGSTIATGDTSESIARDKLPYAKLPMKRSFIARAQDPQSVFPPEAFAGVPKLGRVLCMYENTANVSVENLLRTVTNGKIGVSVTKPSANGTPMKDEWRKVWKFGIAYKLRDGSYTNVQDGGQGVFAGAAGQVINYNMTDIGYDVNRTNETTVAQNNKTIDMSASANVTDASFYVHNGICQAIATNKSSANATANQLEPFTIQSTEFGGAATLDVEGITYVSNAHLDFELDLTNDALWPENPRFELFFKDDSQEGRPSDSANQFGNSSFDSWAPFCYNNTSNGGKYHNGKDINGQQGAFSFSNSIGGFSNFRDARINGFVVFMYSNQDLSADEDIPWQPLIEVDTDLKRFKNWTYDKRWYELEPNSKWCSTDLESGCGYTTGLDFQHDGTKNCEEVPSAFTMTYSDLIPYRSNEDTKVRWAASCMVNGRAVIGNVKMNGTVYNDRVMVSAPGTIDTFAEEYSWDAGSSDGQRIITMESFGDKVLVFKEQDMYILNFTDPNNFFIEAQYHYYGVNNQGSVCRSDYGVSWVAPRYGIMHYDGSSITDLTEEKLTIEQMCWDMSNQDTTPRGIRSQDMPSIAFEPKSRQLIVIMDTFYNYTGLWTGNYSEIAWAYDFNSKDWMLMDKFQYDGSNKKTLTNFVDSGGGYLISIKTESTGDDYPHFNALSVPFKCDPSGLVAYGATHIPQFWTKEIDFGDMGSYKHVYKVVVKYKKSCNATGPTTGFRVQAAINGNYDSLSNMTTSLSTNGWLNSSANEWTIQEFKPSNINEFKNINTIAITLTGSATSSVFEGFEIDSINLVYRIKSVARETF